jgi:hypothetical protein
MPKIEAGGSLRQELERRIQHGQCAYCKAPAEPDRPLTREHVIPQARGGRRKDHRIIVPACARCNHHRGCQEVVLFLLARPRRITAFLDYLATLPPETITQVDPRVFAELYAAVWLLDESTTRGPAWREYLREMCSGRRLHRRRYAARRLVDTVGTRLQRLRNRGVDPGGPSCLLPAIPHDKAEAGAAGEAPVGDLRAALVTIFSLLWAVPAEQVLGEIARAAIRVEAIPHDTPTLDEQGGQPARRRPQRSRVDHRGGRPAVRAAR